MTAVALADRPAVDADIEGAYEWYESQRPGLGGHFLDQLRVTYGRIAAGPERYPLVAREVHRALLRRFPYAV